MRTTIARTNTVLMLLNLFFLQSYLFRFSIAGIPTNLQEILVGILAVIFIANLILNQNFWSYLKGISRYWPILVIVVLSFFAVLQGGEDTVFLIRHLRFIFFGSVLALIFFGTFRSSADKHNGLRWAGIGALAFGIFSLGYNLLGFNVTHDYRLLGPLDAAVYLSFYLTPFFLFFLFHALKGYRKKEYFVYAILLFCLILATRSMGSIGGSMAIILAWVLHQYKPRFIYSAVGKVIITVVVLLTVLLITWTKIIPAVTTSYSSLDERGEIWKVSMELLKQPRNIMFGLGLGQFQNQYESLADSVLGRPPLDYYVLQPHNIFLLFIFNFGLIGVIFLVFFIQKSFSNSSRISTWIFWYFVLHGLIDTPFFKNDLFFLFILFLSLSLFSNSSKAPPLLEDRR
jgi:hypothetical protein